ncbi:MAG: formylglycine-generating enzyme family protein [Acidimicrobiia bacterium]|nr:formylglycine-generating enzyme family protein [Acidimicrobiia bacterium]
MAEPVALTELVPIPGGEFIMGSNDHYPEEAPAFRVQVSPFMIERQQVTNAQFARFVDDTGYVTVAERPLDPAMYPGAPPENLVPGSLVFYPTPGPVDLRHLSQWWAWTPGAYWSKPEGHNSSIEGRADHPVVHVAHEDAEAYARWAGRRLATEAQWEFAARGGLEGAAYTWGDEELVDGKRMAKYFEGAFPWKNQASDGHLRTAPVGTYPPNGFGLSDMAGNVWEWTADWYVDARVEADKPACCVPTDPRGPEMDASFDPAQPQFAIPRKVIKGGSFLCAIEYCRRYRPAARRGQMIDTGMSHLGFRCASAGSSPSSPEA